jgi:hypothetical protein
MDWVISSYRLQVSERDRDPITVELAMQKDGSRRWAVRYRGLCLSRKGEWEYEMQPSSRSQRWLTQHRWAAVKKAQEAAEKAREKLLEECPNG